MIKAFLLNHGDSVVLIVIATILTVSVYRKSVALDQSKRTKILRIGGPALIVFGLMRIFLFPVPDEIVNWTRSTTEDGIAWVDFPSAPEKKERRGTGPDGEEVSFSTLRASLPISGIEFRLGASEIAESVAELSEGDHIAEFKRVLESMGVDVESIQTLPDGTYRLQTTTSDGATKQAIRLGFTTEGIYRAMATSTRDHKNPAIERFLGSFGMQKGAIETPPGGPNQG